MDKIKTIQWKNDSLILIDCRELPMKEEYLVCKDYNTLVMAIKTLAVRGAPAIGVSAAYGVVLASIEAKDRDKESFIDYIKKAILELSETRPTAVNLFWSLNRMDKKLNTLLSLSKEDIKKELLIEAHKIYNEDIETNKKIGIYGNQIVELNSNIITHCNAGALATAGYGTALGVIRSAHKDNKNIHVYIDETRPLLQGSRMTAWELLKEGIPSTLISDSMAAHAMKLDKIDMVIFGADRIATNGDVANKIGSYSLSIVAKEHNIPVYVAAPITTIDPEISSGDEIPIEIRDYREVIEFYGVQTAPSEINVYNPAFDITPSHLIAGIITEKGILRPPYKLSIKKALEI